MGGPGQGRNGTAPGRKEPEGKPHEAKGESDTGRPRLTAGRGSGFVGLRAALTIGHYYSSAHDVMSAS